MVASHAKQVTLAQRLDFFGIDSATRQNLRTLKPLLSRNNGAGIASSSREQSIGLSDINAAVSEMDQGAQQNTAMVEQTTAAAHSLRSEAATLAQGVSAFVLDGAPRARPRAAEPVSLPARGRPVNATVRATALAVGQETSDWEEF